MRSLFALAVLCVACDGVGGSVVGEYHGRVGALSCDPALPCEPLSLAAPEDVPDSADPLELSQCEPAGVLCQGSATTPSSSAQCSGEPALELALERSVELRKLGCSRLRLQHLRAWGEPTSVRIEPESWRHVQLDVVADEPVTIEIAGGQLEFVSLVLSGPITLRVLDSELIRELRVAASDSAAQIELTRLRAVRVAIAAPESAVLLRRSTLDGLGIRAQRIDLESSYVSDAVLRAGWLHATDATLLRLAAEVERSVLSACDGSMLRWTGCASWTSVQGRFADLQLAACREEISVYGSTFERAQLEGDLLLDGASLGATVLGLGEVGAIAAWDSLLDNVTFCADEHALSLGGSTSARCARCDLAPEPVAVDACLVAGSEARVERSPSCETLAQAPLCGEPRPERMRPPRR